MAKLPFRKDIPLSLTEVQDEINRLFDRFWHAGLATGPLDGQDWAPSVDVLEEPDQFVIKAEVPGLDTGDVDVSVSENAVTIKGHKSAERTEGEGLVYLRKERAGGSFSRALSLTAEVVPQADDERSRDDLQQKLRQHNTRRSHTQRYIAPHQEEWIERRAHCRRAKGRLPADGKSAPGEHVHRQQVEPLRIHRPDGVNREGDQPHRTHYQRQ